ncbi:MAG: hypothetical protein LAO30_25700 [Acidobacteriia bacterium]|nr:hypothetical protein [Terriglobia bacterium]
MIQKATFFFTLAVIGLTPVSLPAATGSIRYFQLAGPIWDPYTTSGNPEMQSFIRDHVWGIGTFSPFFDQKLSWMPAGWVYCDSYAIYANSPVVTQHPEWILKDANGRNLYIPWGCSNGTCPQYAGDIANPAFRNYQISQIRTALSAGGATPYGYRGLWLDDVNLQMAVGDGNGYWVTPIDSNTHQLMRSSSWENYFAQLVELIRASLPPTVEILHNSVWYAGSNSQDPYVGRQIAAANYVNVERGFGDGGLTGGTGQFALSTLMRFVDRVHSLGSAVVIEDYYLADQTYSLANYFLINNGFDCFGIAEQTPGNWPARLYSINLGAALSARYAWTPNPGGMLWRRDFSNGFVLVNEPGAPLQTLNLPPGVVDTDGHPVRTVTLNAKQGGIYLYSYVR